MAIPDDLDAPDIVKAGGVVDLPPRVHWSGPPRTFDLDDLHDRVLLYELVMTEGTEDDVRQFIELDQLLDLWPRLVLPPHVRRAWARWLDLRRGIAVSC